MSRKTRYKELRRRGEAHEAAQRMRSFWERWRGTAEGRLFVLGLFGLGALLAELAVLYIYDHRMAWGLLLMVALENSAGREGAISAGLEGGAPPWLAAQVSASQDLIVVALAFPVFLHALHRYHDRDNLVMRRLRKVEAAAQRHRKVADRWGGVGIFTFMVIPFLVNGPLVGAVVGRLAGLSNRAILAPVVLATCAAALAWAYGLNELRRFTSQFHPKLPLALTAFMLALVLAVMFVMDWRDARKAREEVSDYT